MSSGTVENDQITDSVVQTGVEVLGDAPSVSLSYLYQLTSQALALSAQNAVFAQQQANILHQTATIQGVSLIYSLGTASTDIATTQVDQSTIPSNIENILSIIKALKK